MCVIFSSVSKNNFLVFKIQSWIGSIRFLKNGKPNFYGFCTPLQINTSPSLFFTEQSTQPERVGGPEQLPRDRGENFLVPYFDSRFKGRIKATVP